MADQKPAVSAAEFAQLLAKSMPQTVKAGMAVEAAEYGMMRLRMGPSEEMIRPGGTMSGPAMFALADVALYGAVLTRIGLVALAVTSNMNITFLRKPAPKPLIAEARVIRLGKRLAYGDITVWSEGEEEPVAHATGTYSIPSS
ncbi:MAG TPA: PaaI family thioesterase [Azospirillaceae bacterium]|nr:PaaI family thioesterase [Azospirillaceae bacterium]